MRAGTERLRSGIGMDLPRPRVQVLGTGQSAEDAARDPCVRDTYESAATCKREEHLQEGLDVRLADPFYGDRNVRVRALLPAPRALVRIKFKLCSRKRKSGGTDRGAGGTPCLRPSHSDS